MCDELDLVPETANSGAKHLYVLMRKMLSGNVLDEWCDIMGRRTSNLTYATFQDDVWELTKEQLEEDAVKEQKRYLENTKKPRAMGCKEWVNRIKVINNYFPRMKKNQTKYSETDLIEKVIQDNIPDAWQRDFENFDGSEKETLKEVLKVLLKCEKCEGIDKRLEERKGSSAYQGNNKFKRNNKVKNDSDSKYKNPCRKKGHDHEWNDCPDNWKNKKDKNKSKKVEESNNIEEDVSSSDESVSSEESNCLRNSEKLEKPLLSGEVLLSVERAGVHKNYVCLLDSGSSSSLIGEKLVDKKSVMVSKKTVKWETKAGEFKTKKIVKVHNCKLPQFTSNRKFDGDFHVFKKNKNDRYHAILGRDLLEKLGIDLLYSTGEIRWGNVNVAMVPTGHFSGNKSRRKLFEGAKKLANDGQEAHVQEILESKYEAADLDEVTENQVQLTINEKSQFRKMLGKVKKLFSGTKGRWKGPKVRIELKDNVKPVQSKPYKVPYAHTKVFKEEIERLEKIGLFTKVQLSEWSSPSFCIPKKDGRIRIVTDYKKINKLIKRKAKN